MLQERPELSPATAARDAKNLAILEDLNRSYVRAVETADVGWFEENLATDFMNSSPDGSMVDRAGFLAQVARGSAVSNIQAHDVLVRLQENVAFVHALTSYTMPDGRAGSGRYTDVWSHLDGRWHCICAQVTRF